MFSIICGFMALVIGVFLLWLPQWLNWSKKIKGLKKFRTSKKMVREDFYGKVCVIEKEHKAITTRVRVKDDEDIVTIADWQSLEYGDLLNIKEHGVFRDAKTRVFQAIFLGMRNEDMPGKDYELICDVLAPWGKYGIYISNNSILEVRLIARARDAVG